MRHGDSFRARAFVGVVLALLLSVAFGYVAEAEPLTVQDKLGRTVTVEVPVKRAVLFETYELMPALGAWEQLAGVSRYAFDNDLVMATRPNLRAEVADLGAMSDVNMERLLALKPDLVVVWSLNPQLVSFLEGKGVPVLVVNPESIQEVYDTLRLQGRLFGKTAEAERAIAGMEAVLDSARSHTKDIAPAERRRGLWMMGKPTSVGARNSVAAQLLPLVGVDNVAAEVPQSWVDVSVERILAWNPDIVFIWGWARFDPADIVSGTQWRNLAAAQSGAVWKTPHWSTWSPRLAPLALWMAAKAYPERFRDIDVRAEVDGFFRRVYGIPYDRVAPLAP